MSLPSPHQHARVLQFGPPLGRSSQAAILLHGRDGSAEDIASLREVLPLSEHTILAPQATDRTWYPNSFLAPLETNQPWVASALALIEGLVSRCTTSGVPASNVVLIGFSQGACLASEFVASYSQRYAGLIAFTGGLLGPPGADLAHSGRLEGTPMLLSSGDPDPHVPWQRVQETAAIFSGMGAKVTLQRWPGRLHTIAAEEVASATAFFRELADSTF